MAAYTYDYEDLQQVVIRSAVARVDNVGEASGQGIEAEFAWHLNEYVNVRVGAARSEAEVDKVDLSTCTQLPVWITWVRQVDGNSCEGNEMALSPARI